MLQLVCATFSFVQSDLGAGRRALAVLHICLACCQTNKGVRQPEVKQHTLPYCNHMAICQSLFSAHRSACRFPLACHTSHSHTGTLTTETWKKTNKKKRLIFHLWLSTFIHWFHVMFQWVSAECSTHATASFFSFPVLMSHSSVVAHGWVITCESSSLFIILSFAMLIIAIHEKH